MKSFKTLTSFINLLEETVKKKAKALTGHLEHVGDYLWFGKKETDTQEGVPVDPHSAIKHIEMVHHRFKTGKNKKGHELTLKADGGMSVVIGRHHDGKHFVGYKGIKTAHEGYTDHDQIAATGKEHYVRELSPLLDHVKKMKIKPGTAMQGDIIHNAHDHDGTAKPNTIRYKMGKGTKLSLAVHSEHDIDKNTGEFKKKTNYADTKSMQAPGVHAPDLAMDERVKLKLDPERSKKIEHHIKSAKALMKPETVKFAKSILDGKTTHPKFHEFLSQYSNHEARTTGSRDVDRMRAHVDTYMNKSSQKKLSPKSQESLRKGLHDAINKNEHHFHTLFAIHNHITQAKHHLLDQKEEHGDQFDLHPHESSPYKTPKGKPAHEGMVSSYKNAKGKETQAKLTREGKRGFSAVNQEEAAKRFAPKEG
jgi:hypothetical protein